MEWSVPLQKLELTKIRLGNLMSRIHREKKPLVPLAYADGQMVMPVLTILLPHLVVESYDTPTGKLILTLDTPWITNKLTSVQTSLLNAIYQQQISWFGARLFSYDEIVNLFQPMIDKNKLYLYCPTTLEDKRKGNGVIKVWKEGDWIEGVRPGFFVEGERVRVAFQIQGISLQLSGNDDRWTGRARLQHRILSVYLQPPKSQNQVSISSEVPMPKQQ